MDFIVLYCISEGSHCTCTNVIISCYYALYHGALLFGWKDVHALLSFASNSSTAAAERLFICWKQINLVLSSGNIISFTFQCCSVESCTTNSCSLVPVRHIIMTLDRADYACYCLWHWCRYSGLVWKIQVCPQGLRGALGLIRGVGIMLSRIVPFVRSNS